MVATSGKITRLAASLAQLLAARGTVHFGRLNMKVGDNHQQHFPGLAGMLVS